MDRPTLMFSKLLNKAKSISKSRSAFSKPCFAAAAVEANELQSLFGQYMREKGAPKAVPGQEKKRVDHAGRVQKRDGRWSLDWLKRHVLGKRGGFAARNVVTGDPYLKVEEIGIPRAVAKYVTVPERVHRLNKGFLQDCVNVGQTLSGRYRACGAVRLTRGVERLEITRKTDHQLMIGDVVHRHIKDGDLVYVNRPPSLHKHSLLALRVQIHDESVFTINPAICAPLHADFDGDCLHLFVPQSEECRAELYQLMTLPQQLLPSSDGKTIIGLSQDNILATYLMTSTAPSFLNKEQMDQLAIWSSNRRLRIPVVVKSPVGPQWASRQVINMAIPGDFSYRSEDGATEIKDGEILSPGQTNWLTSTNGLVRALALHSPQVAVDHLDCSQSVLREWILLRGFSVSLKDLYGVGDSESRERLIEDLVTNIDEEQNMAVNKELIFDEQFQKLDVIEAEFYLEPLEDKIRTEALEDISVGYFIQKFGEIGDEIISSIGCDNSLLAMVRSGSKGSFGKAFQQFGCVGLQLYKGEHLLALNNNNKLLELAGSLNCEDKWEARGLVKSSLLHGLDPLEFFLHAIAVRAGMLRQSLEVTEPGELFKKLMLFMRDLYVSYDNTVRNKSGSEIVAFSYDGARTSGSNQDSSSAKESVLPGEAVGVLTATAIAQPAYQVMLEASHNVASKKIRPLALLQETIFPLRTSKLKIADRRNILRLKECFCGRSFCEERRCLRVTDQLQPVNIQMLATATALEYIPSDSEEWYTCRTQGLDLQFPWIGHIQFNKTALKLSNITVEEVVAVLEILFEGKSHTRILKRNYLENPWFSLRDSCDCMGTSGKPSSPCLHFSASSKSRVTTRMAERNKKRAFLDAMKEVMVPLILGSTVKGDERVESAKIVWEDAAWSPSRTSENGELVPPNPNGELVVEVIVQEKLATSRGAPWDITKEACCFIDTIDWQRSSPYSTQEICHSFGVEAARDCIVQRLNLTTDGTGTSVKRTHMKLLADLMVFSGDVIGITPFGYRDLLRSFKTSAPFTAGAFRAPVKTFMEAGEKADEEAITGVLASSMFGKRVPVGTGADFILQLKSTVNPDPTKFPEPSKLPMDILDCLKELSGKIPVEIPDTPPPGEVEQASGDPPPSPGNTWTGNANMADAGGSWTANAAQLKEPESCNWVGQVDREVVIESWLAKLPSPTNECNGSPGRSGWGEECLHVAVAKGRDDTGVSTWNSSEPRAEGIVGGAVSSPSVPEQGGLISTGVVVNGCRVPPSRGPRRVVSPDKVDGSVKQDDGPENMSATQVVNPWECHSSRESYKRSSQGDELREFKPTGANNIPLGKVRHFGPRIADTGDTKGVKSDELGQTQESTSGHQGADSQANDDCKAKESASKWTMTTVDESDSEAGWGDIEDHQRLKNTPSGCTSLDGQVRKQQTNHESDRQGQALGGLHVRPVGRRIDLNSGVLISSHEETRRADPRIYSKDWNEIINLVRAVKKLLLNSAPEEHLNEEGQKLLMTQVLPHHPSFNTKVGCGVDFLKVGNYKATKCFFIVRTDGTQEDFSYHKCLQTMAKKGSPC